MTLHLCYVGSTGICSKFFLTRAFSPRTLIHYRTSQSWIENGRVYDSEPNAMRCRVDGGILLRNLRHSHVETWCCTEYSKVVVADSRDFLWATPRYFLEELYVANATSPVHVSRGTQARQLMGRGFAEDYLANVRRRGNGHSVSLEGDTPQLAWCVSLCFLLSRSWPSSAHT